MDRGGATFPVETTSSRVDTGWGVLETTIVRDVSERHRFEEQLRYLADHDTLTGLFNRRRLDVELEREVARCSRYRSRSALLVLDLDNFKDVNDVHGHQAGDEVLRAVAGVLSDRIRGSDLVVRLGGDEFAVLLPQTDLDEACGLARDVLTALASVRVALSGRQSAVTASIGVAGVTEAGGTPAEILAAADIALYEAKESGRNRVAVYDARRLSHIRSRLTWSQRLLEALDNDGFVLHQQPILDLRTRQIDHCELLLRMRRDRGSGVVPPHAFLPIAERSGLITRIDRWVVARSVELLHGGALGDLSVGVNLSGPSLADRSLPDFVSQLLAEHAGLDPHRIVFEITETSVITNMDDAVALTQRLRDLGCRLALDDFGSGFGSFFYLKHLPLNMIKLDGDFVRALRHNAIDRLVVDAMVTIARGLGLQTVAEFVPDEETCTWLAEHGVDHAQGYWIGRPTPIPGW